MRLRIVARSPVKFELELLFDDTKRDSIATINVSHINAIDVPIVESDPDGLNQAVQRVAEVLRAHFEDISTGDFEAVRQRSISDTLIQSIAGSEFPGPDANPASVRAWAIATLIRMPELVVQSDFELAVDALQSLARDGDQIAGSFVDKHLGRVIAMRGIPRPGAGTE